MKQTSQLATASSLSIQSLALRWYIVNKTESMKEADIAHVKCVPDISEDTLPSHWDPMNTATVALFPVAARKQEYKNVLKNLKQNGLNLNIISVRHALYSSQLRHNDVNVK